MPGRRSKHSYSDTFINHIHHHQKYSSSYHHLTSKSEIIRYGLSYNFYHFSTAKDEVMQLFQHIDQKFHRYMELESSNTCFELSTELTPDFVLTTKNNSKYDDIHNCQTERFQITMEKEDDQNETLSLIIDEDQEKLDTITLSSADKDNYDSLDLDIEQG